MKKFLTLLLFSIPLSAAAQTKAGLKGGLNMATISFSDYTPEKRLLPRFNAGIVIEFPFDEKWSLCTGPYYSGKGVRLGRTFSTGRVDSLTIRLNYIELPLNISYVVSENDSKQLKTSAGLYIAYGFNGKISTVNSPRPPTTKLHRKETDQYKRLDAGFNWGFLYEIKQQYGLRLEFSRSIFNIHRAGKEKNMVISLSLIWMFRNKNAD
jgi:hypothetical protein